MAYNLLLVDDSAIVRKVISKTLAMANISVGTLIEAENGKVALEKLKENWVDLVLLDINMPVMNGIEFMEALSQDEVLRGTPVVVVSTEGSSERIDRLNELGIRAYLRKPFTPEALAEALGRILDQVERKKMEPDMPGVKDDMYQMASQILSDWAMMMVEPSPSGTQIFEADQNFLISELQFRGLVSGRWIVVCQSNFVETLMNNLLGESGSDLEVEGKDALRELVNVLSGNLLTAAYGVDTSFELHSPTCKETNFDEAEQIISKSTVVSFRADDFPVAICFLPEGV